MMATPSYVMMSLLVLLILLALVEWVSKGWTPLSRVVFALFLLSVVLYLASW